MPWPRTSRGFTKLDQDQTQIRHSAWRPASRAIASGQLGPKDATNELDFETRNLYEWGTMISARARGAWPLISAGGGIQGLGFRQDGDAVGARRHGYVKRFRSLLKPGVIE